MSILEMRSNTLCIDRFCVVGVVIGGGRVFGFPLFARWQTPLTEVLDLLADGPLREHLAVAVVGLRRMTALHVAPATLLLIDDGLVEGVVAEGPIGCVRRAAPALQSRC